MFNGALVPAALARRKPGPEREPLSRPLAMQVSPMPRGVIDVETEIRNALTALGDIARIRCIELQMVVEPDLTAEADLGCQACLREVLAAAIGRAESGVLASAMRRGDSVAIEVLDDGATAPVGTILLPEPGSLSEAASITAEYQPDRGTRVVLCLSVPR